MDSNDKLGPGQPFEFNELNVQKLKDKYSSEMKDQADNPMKICVKLIFDAAMEKDPDKRIKLSHELSHFLIQPDGVINLFLALIDFDTSSQKVTTHNQRFIAVSNIITCLPKLCVPYEQYCDKILKQLWTFLVSDNPKYSSLASIIVKFMIESPHAKGKNITPLITDPIFKALSPFAKPTMKPNEAIIAIHNMIQNHVPPKLFIVIFSNLFYGFISIIRGPSRLKSPLQNIIVGILNDLQPGQACCLIEQTLFFNKTEGISLKQTAEEDEISLVAQEDAAEDVDISDLKVMIMTILENCDNEKMVLEFFFHFQAKMLTCRDDALRHRCACLVEPLVERLDDSNENKSTGKLDLLNSMATNSDLALELISRTLLNYLDNIRVSESGLDDGLVMTSMTTCLSILEVLSISCRGKAHNSMLQSRVLPTLQELQSFVANCDKQATIKLKSSLDSLIELLSQTPQILEEADENEDAFNKAMADLNDNLVPVRVHALVRFKQMMIANDAHAISKIPQLFDLIECSLADQEPYVFLACINLLSEMSIRKTKELLPRLVRLYSNTELDIQQRINVGEVLVRLARQMNKMAPYYGHEVMIMLFEGTRDPDELIRMSSLTGIGEISKNLGDSLGKYIVDIFTCVSEVIQTDSIPVKSAAVDLLRNALMGLDKFTAESVQRELKSIYGLLKTLRSRTLDDKLCLQVDLALDEIDRLAKEMLGIMVATSDDRDSLVKNIKLLSMLDR